MTLASSRKNSGVKENLKLESRSSTSRLIAFDQWLSAKLAVCSTAKSRFGQLRPLMRLLEYSCHGVPWLVGIMAAILVSHQIEVQGKLLNIFLALILDLLVVGSCKIVFRRTRPSQNADDMMTILMDKYSFPSGHTTRATLMFLLMVNHFDCGVLGGKLLLLWAFCVAMSRIFLGRHHVTDVICGVLIGMLVHACMEWYFWLPQELCMQIIRPIQEEIHL